MKQITFLIFIFSIFLASCSEENALVDNETPKLTGLSRTNSFIYDTVTVNGIALGDGIENTKLLINDSEDGFDLLSVNPTEVKFVPTKSFENGIITLEIDGKKTNSVSIIINKTPSFETVNIKVGKFMMGALSGFADETPMHEVTLTKDLIVFSHEVTKQLWFQVMDTLIVPTEEFNFPADSITWLKAIEFSNKISEIYGLEKTYSINGSDVTFNYESNGWRLPTEAEWEYICKAGSETDFSGNGDINQMGYFDSNSGLNNHKVGEKAVNQFGLYDVHGNMWEWCWDKYESDYYSKSPATNPTGPITGSRHVMRGGSYQDGFNFARISSRTINKIDYKSIGLRLVRNAK